MGFQRMAIVMTGLIAVAGSARATISYQASQASFTTRAQSVADGLTVSSLMTFTGALTQIGSVANDEYIDPTTQIEFLAFNTNGTNAQPFILNGGTLSVTLG